MARKKQNYPLIEGLEITTLAAEGKAMGRWNDQVVFVPMTVPGDVVDGIEEYNHVEPYVVVYNPVLQQICFAIEQGTELSEEAIIYDLRGRVLMQFSTRQAAQVNSLPKGTYVLKWTESGHQRSVKFMKL